MSQSAALALQAPPLALPPARNPPPYTYALPTNPVASGGKPSSSSTSSSARKAPSPPSPHFDEIEIDTYCTVCDKLILPILPPSSNATGSKSSKRSVKVDENGVPQFIQPVAPRIPGQASKEGKKVKPALKRTATAEKKLAALTSHLPPRAVPVEPPRPRSMSRSPSTGDEKKAEEKWNRDLYCSLECAKIDEERCRGQADDLELEMNRLWGIETEGTSNSSSGGLSSPLWMSQSSDSEGNQTDLSSQSERSRESKPAVEHRKKDMFDLDFNYLDMARTGVEYGLMERERRRSMQSQGSSSGRIPISGLTMKRTGSNSAYGGYPTNGPISSSDSLSSLWSSSDGRTFSEDPSSFGSGTGFVGANKGVFRGLAPLAPLDGAAAANFTAARRPSLAGTRSLSSNVPTRAALDISSTPTRKSSIVQSPRSRPVILPKDTSSSSSSTEVGSAPAATASLFHSYAMAFHRTPSGADLARMNNVSPRLRPLTVSSGPRRRDSSVESVRFEARQQRLYSASELKGRLSFSSVNLSNLGNVSISSLAMKNTPTGEDAATTPTQSFVVKDGLFVDEPARLGSSLRHENFRMARAGSAESSKTSRSGHSRGSDEQIFEDDETAQKRQRRKSVKIQEENEHDSPPRSGKLSTSSRSMPFGSLHRAQPTMAITIGDEIIPRERSSLPPPFCRSFSPSKQHPNNRSSASLHESAMMANMLSKSRSGSLAHPGDSLPTSAGTAALRAESGKIWSWESLEKAGGKMYELPMNGQDGEKGKLFYFH